MSRTQLQQEDFFKLLTVATIEPSLQSLLIFDATEKDILKIADQWAEIIKIAHRSSSSTNLLMLNSSTTEENLWGRFTIPRNPQENDRDNLSIVWQPSKLVQQNVGDLLLVVIPDLSRLSLLAMRACVTLLDSKCATLQRDGIDVTWQPHFWCIAGCQSDRLGEISPHLLDRFALRCKPPNIGGRNLDELSLMERLQLLDAETEPQTELLPIALELATRSQEIIAQGVIPLMTGEAIDRVQAYFSKYPLGMRRLLTLARLARGLASLAGEDVVKIPTVDRAVRLLGISQNLSVPTSQVTTKQSSVPESLNPRRTQSKELTSTSSNDKGLEQGVNSEVKEPLPPVIVEPKVESAPEKLDNPYLEDDAPVMRELEPLTLPMVSARSSRAGFGHPIGTQSTTTLEDISILGTVLEAAKFYNYRKSRRIWLSDLRSYRRIPVPQYQLLCAIDFTCLQDRDWLEALKPHLRDWAYVLRASIGIIRMGAKGENPLRSHLVQAKNLLSPAIFKALEGESGSGTPLAHGLDLAGRTARAALQHGRSRVDRVRLVVLTDGRGNIPLLASLEGELNYPVAQEGIDDALTVARGLSQIPRLDIVFLDPQPQFSAELPQRLAQELGAVIETVEIKRSPPPLNVEASDVKQEAI